jgi:hypothetical protein
MPDRFDLVLAQNKNFWHSQIESDSVYSCNTVTVNNDDYWISSGSQNQFILEYHKKYISLRQHQLRSQLFIEYATLLLETYDINHGFFLTADSHYLLETVTDTSNWFWHSPFKGMHSFRTKSKYADLDQSFHLTQPISLIHFDFIKQFLLPKLDLNWRSSKEISGVENMLYRKYKEAVIKKNDCNS